MRIPLVVLLVVALAGCAPVAVERGHVVPVVAVGFASDEEAVAAATEAYARYQAVVDAIAGDGGDRPERIFDVAAGEFASREVEGFGELQDRGLRLVGASTFRDVVLQQRTSGPEAAVTVYLCDDISGTDVVNSSGQSVVSTTRPDTNYFVVVFDLGRDRVLRVASAQRWDDRSC